jgi:EamA domain-containing membrane protein RarD
LRGGSLKVNAMQLPQGLIDFLVYLAPSLLVFLTAFFLIKKFLDTDHDEFRMN